MLKLKQFCFAVTLVFGSVDALALLTVPETDATVKKRETTDDVNDEGAIVKSKRLRTASTKAYAILEKLSTATGKDATEMYSNEVFEGNADSVEVLLDARWPIDGSGYANFKIFDANVRNNEGWTPLMIALKLSYDDRNSDDDRVITKRRLVIDTLCRRAIVDGETRVDVNAKVDITGEFNGYTASLLAIKYYPEVAYQFLSQLLYTRELKLDVAVSGWTVVKHAVQQANFAVFELFLNKGASFSNISLDMFVDRANEGDADFVHRSEEESSKMLSFLGKKYDDTQIAKFFDVNKMDYCGKTALMRAVKSKSPVVHGLLRLSKRLNVNLEEDYSSSPEKHTALTMAVESSALQQLGWLLETREARAGTLSVDPVELDTLYTRNGIRKTMLMIAMDNKFVEISKELVRAGAFLGAPQKNMDTSTALMHAIDKNLVEVSKEIIKKSIVDGVSLDVWCRVHGTALSLAIKNKSVEVSNDLIDAGANLNTQGNHGLTLTALTLSIANNLDEVSKEIIKKVITKENPELKKALLDGQGNYQRTSLMYAIKNKSVEVSNDLIDAGASLDAKDFNGWTVLMHAISKNLVEVSKKIIKKIAETENLDVKQARLDAQDPQKMTALVHAIRQKSVEISKELIDAGAILDVEDSDGKTALMHAIDQEAITIFDELLKAGADIHKQNVKQGKSAWMHLSKAPCSESFVEVIKQRHINTSVNRADQINTDHSGWDALHYAASRPSKFAAEPTKSHLYNLLNGTGGCRKHDVNAKNKAGETVLMIAVKFGGAHEIKLVIQAQKQTHDAHGEMEVDSDRGVQCVTNANAAFSCQCCGLNTKDSIGNTALMHAVQRDGEDEESRALMHTAVNALLEEQVDMNVESNAKMTALMHAVLKGNFSALSLLVKAKANLNKKNDNGETALMLLLKLKESDGRFKAFKELVTAGADINEKDNDGTSVLMLLLNNTEKPEEIITWLINYNTEKPEEIITWPINYKHEKNNNPYKHEKNNNPKALLSAGVHPNLESTKGWTALMYAALNGHFDAASALIKAGADVHKQTREEGKTVLMLLLNSKNLNKEKLDARFKAFTELVTAGADINKQDDVDGNSVLMLLLNNTLNTQEPERIINWLTNYKHENNDDNPKAIKPNLKSKTKWTALMYAVSKGNVEAFEALVEAGADFNQQNENLQTALMLLTVSKNDESFEMMDWLVKNYTRLQPNSRIDVNIEDNTGSTALMLGAEKCRMPSCLPEHFEVSPFSLLLNWNDVEHDLNAKNEKGQTALMIASMSGALQEFKALMKKKYPADREVQSVNGEAELAPAARLAVSGLNNALKQIQKEKEAKEKKEKASAPPMKKAREERLYKNAQAKAAEFREILQTLLRVQGFEEKEANDAIERGLEDLNNNEAI